MTSLLARLALASLVLAAAPLAGAQVPHLERGFDPALQFVVPEAVNEDGTVVAGLAVAALNTGPSAAFRWTPAEGIGFLTPPAPWTVRSVVDLSRSGDTLVGALSSPGGTSTAFTWTPSAGFVPVAAITARNYSFLNVFGVSDDGSVIYADAATPGDMIRSIVWSAAGGLRTIGAQSVDPVRARVMNDDGSVVAGVAGPGAAVAGASLFRWTEASGLRIFPVPTGATSLLVSDIDAAGETIVGTLNDSMNRSRAFRWTEAAGFEVLPSGGFGRAEGVLISRSGDTIVGRWRPALLAGGPPTSPAFWLRAGQPPVAIPPLPGGDIVTPVAIDDTGDTVLCNVSPAVSPSTYVPIAFAWTPSGGPVPLLGRNVDHLTMGRRLSANGQHAVGEAIPILGVFSAYELSWDLGMPTGRQVGTRYGTPTPGSTGVGARIFAQGSALRAANDFALTLVDAPPESFVLFLNGTTRAFQPNLAGGLGTLLIGGGIGRFVGPGQLRPTGAVGTLSMRIDLAALPRPGGAVAVASGDTYRFQAWFRDVDQGPTSNLSDAVEVTFR